jgi:hypothetical protein
MILLTSNFSFNFSFLKALDNFLTTRDLLEYYGIHIKLIKLGVALVILRIPQYIKSREHMRDVVKV